MYVCMCIYIYIYIYIYISAVKRLIASKIKVFVYIIYVSRVFPLSSCLPLFGFVPVLISSLLIKSSHLCSSCLRLISLS